MRPNPCRLAPLALLTLFLATGLATSQADAAEVFDCSVSGEPIVFGSTVVDTIEVSGGFLLGDIQVCVDITHAWIGDIEMTLTSPSGTVVQLHSGGGGSADDLKLTYCTQGPPHLSVPSTCECVVQPFGVTAMSQLSGEPVNGTWTLQIDDTFIDDSGVLHGWCLHLFDTGIGCFDPVPSCAGVGDDVIVRGEESGGLIDSAGAVRTSLTNLGESPGIIEDLLLLEALSPRRAWICLGTFPDNHVLSEAEGALLADLAASGVSVYIEGADVWAYDPQTPFEQYDGVENQSFGTLVDGDDSLVELVGASSGFGVSVIGLGTTYIQDQVASEYTDRLQPAVTNPDLGGPSSGVIWWSDTSPAYAVATHYASTIAPVIASSFEFGGIEAGRDTVMDRYLGGLPLAPLGPGFSRGDCNGDGGFNLPDAVTVLHYLFLGIVTPPCLGACDANDDGAVDVPDAVTILNYLFSGGPAPAAPFPGCGADPTSDSLGCDDPSC